MIELTVDNFEEEVLKKDKPVLVDWWGETCENCLAIMPAVVELSENMVILYTSLNLIPHKKKVRRFCIQHKIMGLPVISIYHNGEKVDEVAKDDCTKEKIEELIKKYI